MCIQTCTFDPIGRVGYYQIYRVIWDLILHSLYAVRIKNLVILFNEKLLKLLSPPFGWDLLILLLISQV